MSLDIVIFIDNMLAGVGGIDAVLLVIAADEGVMPQTREHLAILKLMQIKRGLIVLTKMDQVEDQEWAVMVEEDVRKLVRGTFLEYAPILHVSALQGKGLAELASAIDNMLSASEPKKDIGKPRLPVDRVFTLKGFGTVVTGTLIDGEFSSGQQVEVLPGKLEARIRGIQNHKKKVEIANPGNRTAINLTGIDADQIRRGDVVVKPSTYTPSGRVDAKIEMLAEASGNIGHNDHFKCFLGSGQTIVRIRVIGKKEIKPGDWGWVQMEFDEPVVADKGDRFILRRPSPPETIAGGTILDAHPARRTKRFSEDVLARMSMLESGSDEQIILSTLASVDFLRLDALVEKSGIAEKGTREIIERLMGRDVIMLDAENDRNPLICRQVFWQDLVNKITGELESFYEKYPLKFGIGRTTLNQKIKLDPKNYTIVMQKLISDGLLKEKNNEAGLGSHEIVFTKTDEENVQKIIENFKTDPYSPPTLNELKVENGDDLIDAMISAGRLVQVSDDIVFLPETYHSMLQTARDFLGKEKKITLAQFRDLFNTSRKYALAFLEHMDKEGITVRKDDYRVIK